MRRAGDNTGTYVCMFVHAVYHVRVRGATTCNYGHLPPLHLVARYNASAPLVTIVALVCVWCTLWWCVVQQVVWWCVVQQVMVCGAAGGVVVRGAAGDGVWCSRLWCVVQ